MPDEDLRELERRWAEGQGDLAAGEAFSRALERAGADTGRRLEVRLQVLRGHLRAAGLGHLTLGPQPELDPMAASFLIPGEEALRAWHALRGRTEASGAYPVIVGREQDFEETLEVIHEHSDLTPETTLGRVSSAEPPVFAMPDWAVGLEQDLRWTLYPPARSDLSLTRAPVSGADVTVRLVLLPTRTPWHAAAYLRFGLHFRGPEVHAALHRSWFDRFAAAPAAVTIDMVEFVVGTPPRTREECLRLAAEQALYFGVDPSDRALGEHAAALLGAPFWSLWC